MWGVMKCLSVGNLLVVVQTLTGTTSSVRRTWRRLWTNWPKESWHQKRSLWYAIKPSRRPTSTETASCPLQTSRTWSQKLLTSWGMTAAFSLSLCHFWQLNTIQFVLQKSQISFLSGGQNWSIPPELWDRNRPAVTTCDHRGCQTITVWAVCGRQMCLKPNLLRQA